MFFFDSINSNKDGRGVVENSFTGFGIVFETIRIYPGPAEVASQDLEPHYRLFTVSGRNLSDFDTAIERQSNRSCVEHTFTWFPERIFYLVLHKIGNNVHVRN